MPTYNEYGEEVETEEERRRRLEREAAYGASQDAEDASMGAAMTAMADNTPRGGFMDAVGNYAQRRFDQAVQPFTDPTAALNRRMGMTPEEAANTEVQSTQVKTYGDGSQEEIVKRQIPASTAPGAAAPVNPADMGAVPQAQPQQQQKSPEEIARNAQALREMAQGRAAPQAQPTAVPQQLPAQGAIDPNAPMPNIGQVPQPGPGVQVAGGPPGAGVAEAAQAAQAQQPVRPVAPPPTTVTGAPQVGAPAPAPSLAQAGAQAAAAPAPVAQPPAEPAWLAAANAAGTDFGKLVDVAAKFPEARASIQAKLEGVVENSRKANEAQKIVEAAQAGDPKAMNKLEQALRPTRGKEKEEVTTGDYLKAYMYARLGLNDLAADVQAKISGKDTKFGQVQLGNTTWSVETSAKTGEIIRAKDDEGNVATANTINKLAAAGQKYGAQAFGFTGGISTVPSTGEPLQARQNSITGDAEYVHMTGPKKGQIYAGSEIPVQQRVSTQAMVDYNKKLIDFNTNPNIAGATELMKFAVANDTGDGKEIAKAKADIANKLGIGGLTQALGGTQQGGGATNTTQQGGTQQGGTQQGGTQQGGGSTTPQGRTQQGGTQSLSYTPSEKKPNESQTAYKARLEKEQAAFNAEIQRRKEMQLALEKPAAAALGADAATTVKNQAFADRTYDLFKPINDAILKSTGSSIGAGVDTVAAAIGKSTEGSKAISRLNVLSYGILSNIPRFEGPQSDIDVQMYKQAAGDFANRKLPVEDRLAALDALRTILQRYDKAGKNDWTFAGTGQAATGGGMRIVGREKVR